MLIESAIWPVVWILRMTSHLYKPLRVWKPLYNTQWKLPDLIECLWIRIHTFLQMTRLQKLREEVQEWQSYSGLIRVYQLQRLFDKSLKDWMVSLNQLNILLAEYRHNIRIQLQCPLPEFIYRYSHFPEKLFFMLVMGIINRMYIQPLIF